MTGRFTVLASGSSGNAALLETNGFGLLIDCGLHPRMLTARLREAGASWENVNAVILTHIHGDHWKDLTLGTLRSYKIPLYAHAEHHDHLSSAAVAYESLHRAKLTRDIRRWATAGTRRGLVLRPFAVSHDAEPTFAFRIDRTDSQGLAWSIGYASDLGCGSSELIEAFAGVNRARTGVQSRRADGMPQSPAEVPDRSSAQRLRPSLQRTGRHTGRGDR